MACKIKYPTVPTAYDADLSDEEKLILLMAQLQEASEVLAVYSEVSVEWVEEFVYTSLLPIKIQLDALSQSCNDRFANADAAIQDMTASLSNYISVLMLYTYTLSSDYTDAMVDQVNYLLDNIIVGDVLLRNVMTGEMTSTQTIVNDLAGLHQNNPAAGAFDALELTCSTFDALSLNAFVYDFTGL